MNNDFQKLCELFVANKNVLSKEFAFSQDIMNMSSSLLLTGRGVTADAEKIKENEKIFKEETGVLSTFRGNVKIPIICKMILSGVGKEYLRCISKAYKLLKEKKMSGNEYKLLAATIIYDHGAESEYEKYANLTYEIFSMMKKEHRFLTKDEDISFAAILATSGISSGKLIPDMEACYSILRKKFRDRNAVQSLCQVLALDSRTPEEKCERVAEIYDALRQSKHRFGTGYELASLGTLAMLDTPIEEIVAFIGDADDFLKKQRGFGNVTITAKTRRLYAAQLCALFFSPKTKKGTDFAMGSTLALTISTHAAMAACLGATVATTAAH